MADYSTGLAQFDPDPVAPPGEQPLRITVYGGNRSPEPQQPADGMTPLGDPTAPPPPTDTPSITLHPVDHQPEFPPAFTLHEVDHTPEFEDEAQQAQGARDVAAARTARSARPPGGREEGTATRAIEFPGKLAGHALEEHGRQIASGQTVDAVGMLQGLDQELNKIALIAQNYRTTGELTPEEAGDLLKFSTNLMGAGVSLGTTVGHAGGATVGIFGGKLAKTADLKKLRVAEQMERDGHGVHDIWDATGWFKGADGQWKFEIPDTAAKWNGPEAYWAAEQARREVYLNQIEAKYGKDQRDLAEQRMKETGAKGNIPVPLNEAFDHPELYKAYPSIKNEPLHFEDLGIGIMGEHRGPEGIALNPESGANKSVALHEIMHGVQNIEDFARGGSYHTPEVTQLADAQTGPRRAELKAEVDGILDAKDKVVKSWLRGSNVPYEILANEYWEKHPELVQRMKEIEAEAHQLNEAHRRATREAYKRLAGEVESRNVQERAEMTPGELKRRPPWETEDRPRDKQLVVRPGTETQMPSRAMDDLAADWEAVQAQERETVNRGLQEPADRVGEAPGTGTDQAAAEGAKAPETSLREPGGDHGVAEAQRAAESAAAGKRPLEGLPQEPLTIKTPEGDVTFVPGPLKKVHDVAEAYMKEAGLKYKPVTSFESVSVPRAKRIAQAYEDMPHAPNDPKVKAAYEKMIDETMAQLRAILKHHPDLKIEFIKPDMKDPYEASPRMATIDVRDNNHLWVFPTDSGFGSSLKITPEQIAQNPLLRDTGVVINGHKVLANDAFRIVHDYFGHMKDGFGFRAEGEENAWRSHSRMYSPLARKAMTTETRGQNSWLNYGPHGDKNRKAKSADTVYADQKTGLMPDWTHLTGAQDPYVAPPMFDERGHSAVNAGVNAPTHKAQTVADPHRMMYPGIYESPRKIAEDAASRVAPEDVNMKRLWGVSRGDLDEMAKGRKGNEDPKVQLAERGRGSLSAQNIQTPKNTERLIDILAEAGKKPGIKHADAWYIMDPVYKRMEQIFGPEEAKVRFERLNTLMGMASPGSDVLTEIQRGTAANMKATQGKFQEFFDFAGTPREFRKGPDDLKRVEAHPYHRTSQAEPMRKYLETGSIQSKEAKVPAYVHASSVPEVGFQTRGPVADSHFSRGIGLADTRKGPTDVASSASRPEYQTLQPWWEKDIAGALGIESVPAQARLWTVLGPRTGVNSALGQGKLELLTQQIMKAAKRLNITPEAARDLILSGKAHAGAVAGGAVGLKALAGDESDTPSAQGLEKFREGAHAQ